MRHPVVVVGVDGADWRLIERLWAEGRLPNLRSIADRGVSAPIETFHKESPVIWTSIATGVYPEIHGITGFAVRTEQGDRPVTSTVRKVPAIWNMASATGLRVAVLGWWGTWPAEEINGVVAQLVQWIGSPAINNQERERLDHELARRELPSIADLRLHYLP